jgi:deoxyribodipyrimidine photo-lyase
MEIIRYKKDLRVEDHEPLINAISSKEHIIAIYIREPSIMSANDFSEFHQYWIQESLNDLKQKLNTLSIPLIIRY